MMKQNLILLTHNPSQSEFLGSVILIRARRVVEVEEGRVPAVPQAHRLPAEPALAVRVSVASSKRSK